MAYRSRYLPAHLPALFSLMIATVLPSLASAQDVVKVAIPQRGNWETSVADVGQRAGIFAKHGIKVEVLYTSGGGETLQALISGSVDVAIGTGTASIMAAFAKGAPIRPIASSTSGARDIFWYVPANSPLKSLKEAAGKTIGFSAGGSSSNIATLKLIKQTGVAMTPVATGTSQATYAQVMSGQIDVGWSAVPFGIDLLEDKKIRLLARYDDIPEYRNMTARMHVANLNFIEKRPDVLKRFLAAYNETLDWMYKGDEGLLIFCKIYDLPEKEIRIARDQFTPKEALDLKRRVGIDVAMEDALALKFISKPLTEAEQNELFKYYYK
ncbi:MULTISPECIES: ABC transporter substrate-binding protein [unclassified Beijerinckia]|uniref:ABC transporter substrate-binding protein n=1 Tax=unclassified Beijerinckia TaxID=2638183 RepID=UPI00089A00D0|nr:MULTISPECIES: ABC transporter substrate-binding protein [unclassified Beijerinckia]MDH7799564.1 NitT/TauT family transport system substrate-binding protein [Beijerinckia sp. GAS462]SEB46756.1 NitT/TauT family transport system substrate-binding protein [Beijerinckia sp. 28-YEA-48]